MSMINFLNQANSLAMYPVYLASSKRIPAQQVMNSRCVRKRLLPGSRNCTGVMQIVKKLTRYGLKVLNVFDRHLESPVAKTRGNRESSTFFFEPWVRFSSFRMELENRLVEGQVQKVQKRLALFPRTHYERFVTQLVVKFGAQRLPRLSSELHVELPPPGSS